MSKNPFQECLDRHPEYVLPYGTSITPDSFRKVGDFWTIDALNEDGNPVRWEVQFEGDQIVKVDKNLKAVEYSDPLLNMSKPHEEVTTLEWYDLILLTDADGHWAKRNDPWEGDDFDSRMTRIEHNIVRKSEKHVPVMGDLAEFEAQINEALKNTTLSVEVFSVGEVPLSFDDQMTSQRPVRLNLDGVYERSDSWLVAPGWQNPDAFSKQVYPNVVLRTSGSVIMDLDSVNVVHMPHYLEHNPVSKTYDTQWWLVQITGTDIGIPVIAEYSAITINTDYDGSFISISGTRIDQLQKRLKLEDLHNRRWGRWMDDNQEISQAEMQEANEREMKRFYKMVAAEEEA